MRQCFMTSVLCSRLTRPVTAAETPIKKKGEAFLCNCIKKPHLEFNAAWNLRTEHSNVLMHVKAKNVLFGEFRGSQSRGSLHLPKKTEVFLFRERLFLLFWCHCSIRRITETLHHARKIRRGSNLLWYSVLFSVVLGTGILFVWYVLYIKLFDNCGPSLLSFVNQNISHGEEQDLVFGRCCWIFMSRSG